jgi:pyruvate/2-oxoglutarate dehydrogenase complex dihydrolipoamide acyltransferase (E2) component
VAGIDALLVIGPGGSRETRREGHRMEPGDRGSTGYAHGLEPVTVRAVVFAVLVGVVALGPAGAFAEPKPKAATETAKPAEPTERKPAKSTERGVENEPSGETQKPKASPPTGKVVAVDETDEGVKTYQFGTIEVEGRLKAPQIIYFLRRVRAEFEAGLLGHRSFMLELSDTRRHPSLNQ